MKKIFSTIIFYILFFSSSTFAGNIPCNGNVTHVMADHSSCSGNVAFKTTGSNGKWICTKSKEAGSLVLTALVAGKHLSAYIDDAGVTLKPDGICEGLPHYRNVSYVIIIP